MFYQGALPTDVIIIQIIPYFTFLREKQETNKCSKMKILISTLFTLREAIEFFKISLFL